MSQFFKALILFAFIIPHYSIAKSIENISIIGNETVARGTILSYLPLEKGEEYTNQLKPLVIETLLSTNLFSEVNVEMIGGSLIIRISENPTIKFFEIKNYENDVILSETIVSELLKNFGLSPGKIFVKDNLDKLLNQLSSMYKFNAYYESNFEVKRDLDNKNRLGIEIIINEKEQALIDTFSIKGNTAFEQSELLDLFDIGEADFFLFNYFTKKDQFSKQLFDAGIEALSNKYFQNGYLAFEIEKKELLYDPILKKLSITIHIKEGSLFKLGKISFSGNLLNQSSETLINYFDLKKDEVFNRSKVVTGINKIEEIYKDNGYAYAKVNSSIELAPNSDTVNVNLEVLPDNQIYINRIEIRGNHRTQGDVIRRELGLLESSVYSKSQLNDSISSIKRLGYFSDVSFDLKRHSSDPSKADLLIDVTETKTGEFSIGLSHSNSTGAALNVGISQNNILGTGNTLKAAFSNSDAVKETSLYFMDPYINDAKHSISYGFFSKQVTAANLDTSSYVLDENGFNFGYGLPFSDKSRINADIRISSIDLTCGNDLKNIYEVNQCARDFNTDFNSKLTYSFNDLNDFYFPTDGSKITLIGGLGLPIGDMKYYSLGAFYKSYDQVLSDKILKIGSRLQLSSGYGGDTLPFFKRLYEGGSSSVRGFDFNSLGAKYSNDKPKGGELSVVSTIGLGSKLDFLGIDNPNMRGMLFVDAGSIHEKLSSFTFDEIRSSYGLQFSWLTPIGPIGLNFAQPISKKKTDKTETFAFELGTEF